MYLSHKEWPQVRIVPATKNVVDCGQWWLFTINVCQLIANNVNVSTQGKGSQEIFIKTMSTVNVRLLVTH